MRAWRIFSLHETVVSFRLVKLTKGKKPSQGDFYAHSQATTRRLDFHWVRDAQRLRVAGNSQRGATGAAESAANVRKTGPRGAATSGHLRAGRILRGGGAGEEFAIAGGAMPMVVLEQETQDGKEMKGQESAETRRELRNSERPRRGVRAARRLALTTPDMVLLSLLAERPMHGYQANLELERREIRDWAGISRPQVYYSLEKLARAGLIRSLETDEPAAGPERSTFETTAKGRAALADALEREEWARQRDRPPFLTWMALSWQARPGVFATKLDARQEFLEMEIAREKE